MNAATDVVERDIQTVDSAMASMVTRAEIDMQIATANKYPRSIKTAMSTAMELATLNEKMAAECIYALPRDGKVVEGPSARFAEIMAYSWKNCRAGARVVDESSEFVTSQGVFHDLQQNVAITYEVQRRITDKYGRRYKADMIGVTANAASSIALRNAILKGIPKAIWNTIYQKARQVVAGDVTTLANRRAEAINSFQIYGVTPENICATLGVKGVEDIGLDQLVVLRGIFTAIKEGDTTPEQAFAASDGPKVDMPKAKTAEQPAQQEKKQAPPAASTEAAAPPPQAADDQAPQSQANPTEPADDRPMAEGQLRVLRAKLKNAVLNDIDVKAKFGRGLGDGDTAKPDPGWKFSDFALVQAWITERAGAQ